MKEEKKKLEAYADDRRAPAERYSSYSVSIERGTSSERDIISISREYM